MQSVDIEIQEVENPQTWPVKQNVAIVLPQAMSGLFTE
jgi:hypothetical protein